MTSLFLSNELHVDTRIYKARCINDAVKKYAQFCQITIKKGEKNKLRLFFQIKPAFLNEGNRVRSEFLNYILGISLSQPT